MLISTSPPKKSINLPGCCSTILSAQTPSERRSLQAKKHPKFQRNGHDLHTVSAGLENGLEMCFFFQQKWMNSHCFWNQSTCFEWMMAEWIVMINTLIYIYSIYICILSLIFCNFFELSYDFLLLKFMLYQTRFIILFNIRFDGTSFFKASLNTAKHCHDPKQTWGSSAPFCQHLPSLKLTVCPLKWWFPIGISFSRGLFSGDMLVSGRVVIRP